MSPTDSLGRDFTRARRSCSDVMFSVVNRGGSLSMRVPFGISRVAIMPFPFPGTSWMTYGGLLSTVTVSEFLESTSFLCSIGGDLLLGDILISKIIQKSFQKIYKTTYDVQICMRCWVSKWQVWNLIRNFESFQIRKFSECGKLWSFFQIWQNNREGFRRRKPIWRFGISMLLWQESWLNFDIHQFVFELSEPFWYSSISQRKMPAFDAVPFHTDQSAGKETRHSFYFGLHFKPFLSSYKQKKCGSQ